MYYHLNYGFSSNYVCRVKWGCMQCISPNGINQNQPMALAMWETFILDWLTTLHRHANISLVAISSMLFGVCLMARQAINRFRVYMNGSQQCHDANAVWFVSTDKFGSNIAQCNVTKQNSWDLHSCNIQCLCPCGVQCDYLPLHVQFPPWMKRTLACSYEQLVQC